MVPGEGECIPTPQHSQGRPAAALGRARRASCKVPLGNTKVKGPAGLFPHPKPQPSWGDNQHSTAETSGRARGERHPRKSGLALACAASVC